MAKKTVELPAVMVISAHNGNFCPPFDEPGVAPDGALVCDEGLGAPVALWEYIPETKAALATLDEGDGRKQNPPATQSRPLTALPDPVGWYAMQHTDA